jgi:hypothetical protein
MDLLQAITVFVTVFKQPQYKLSKFAFSWIDTRSENPRVGGSIPPLGTITPNSKQKNCPLEFVSGEIGLHRCFRAFAP